MYGWVRRRCRPHDTDTFKTHTIAIVDRRYGSLWFVTCELVWGFAAAAAAAAACQFVPDISKPYLSISIATYLRFELVQSMYEKASKSYGMIGDLRIKRANCYPLSI